MAQNMRLVHPSRASFEVVCAGEPFWKAARLRGDGLAPPAASAAILDATRALARRGLRVGLATVLDDNRPGRALLAQLAALGIDVSGVTLAPQAAELVVVDAAGGQLGVLSERGTASHDFELPSGWSSRVILLSGLSPVTSKAAALCKAARKARREGTSVVLDVAGSLRLWTGRDPRTISMVLREADVVHCSFMDLAVLGIDSASVRGSMRPDATLVVSDDAGTVATGPFGEVRVKGASRNAGDGCAAAICADLARPRPREAAESLDGRWHRVLREEAQ
jgi:sugar/nucleoside kinase (ribokinase family)